MKKEHRSFVSCILSIYGIYLFFLGLSSVLFFYYPIIGLLLIAVGELIFHIERDRSKDYNKNFIVDLFASFYYASINLLEFLFPNSTHTNENDT